MRNKRILATRVGLNHVGTAALGCPAKRSSVTSPTITPLGDRCHTMAGLRRFIRTPRFGEEKMGTLIAPDSLKA